MLKEIETVKLGEKIRRYRKALGLNQTELGERLGVKTNAVSKWECGRVEDIPTSKIKAMAIMFNVPVSELIDDEAPGVQPPDGLELTATEHELLTLYRGVNPDGQRYIMKQAQFASSQKEYCPTPAPIARSAG